MTKNKRQTKKRFSQPERRKRTQDRLLSAAIEILIERGYSNLTLDVVSRRAGVSRGAQTNYYPTKKDLLLATARQVINEGMPERSPRLPKPLSRIDLLDAFIRESKRFFLSPRYTAMIELHVAGRHDPALAKELELLQRKARQDMDNIWLDLFTATGASRKDAKHIVEMTDHFFRGVALLACMQTRVPNAKEVEPWAATLRKRFIDL